MKNLYIFLLFLIGTVGFAQNPVGIESKLSPDGIFENVFDQYGNKYTLADLKAGEDKETSKGITSKSAVLCNSGMFNLFFETGSGMEDSTNAAHNARRAVVCQVFSDLSDFINSPLKNPGNIQRVNIWVRNINQVPGVPSNVLGLATAFYNMPSNTTAGFGGIADNEIWKTIQSGRDSYTNVIAPLNSTNPNPTNSSVFYHGMMAFNFNSVSWNTNLSATAPAGLFDLYSVVLHEVTHALGFASLMNQNGTSLFGTGFNYFSRYDRFLRNNAESQALITNGAACSSMYNYNFNTGLTTSVLHPNTPPCVTNVTTCSTAIKFVGTSIVPVYTPNCFEQGSSLSHFEDQCVSPNVNDAYFTMSNALGAAVTKRFLKTEERNALSDIGYSLNITYGNNSNALNSFKNYGGTATAGITVAGINDGINTNATFSFVGGSGTTIVISGILNNDFNAVSFECLEDVTTTAVTLSPTSGNSGTTVNFNSANAGLHLLRYVPINAAGQRGNITYVYVYVMGAVNCAVSACNLVNNGGFESFSPAPLNSAPNSLSQLNRSCGWNSVNATSTPDYFHASSTSTLVDVPCNLFGSQNENHGLNAYAGMWVVRDNWGTGQPYYESLLTELNTPLLANTSYQLSFDVSMAEGASANAIRFQAYLSSTPIISLGTGDLDIPVGNMNMLFTNPTFSSISNGWERITITIPAGPIGGQRFLYIGGLNNVQFNPVTPAAAVAGCPHINYNSGAMAQQGHTYYYVDNVELVPLSDAGLDLPATVCRNVTLSDLSDFLVAAPSNGVFTGTGVTGAGGVFTFNAATAGVGTHIITYNYMNNLGCEISITDSIIVSNTLGGVPIFDPVMPICPGAELAALPTTSNNEIEGTWSPDLDNTTTTTYTFTPNSIACTAIATLIITVLSENDPACEGCLSSLTLSAPQGGTSTAYQLQNWIETNNNYSVASGQDVTMKAGDFIYLKPDTFISGGSSYLAEIQGCGTDRFSAKEKEAVVLENDIISVYPNPTNDLVTVSFGKINIKSIVITSMEGKLIYTNNAVNRNSYQLNVGNYQNGIYIVNIETNAGKIIREKLIKN